MKNLAAGANVRPDSAYALFNQDSKIIVETIKLPPEVK
jgi:hypothetical protein